jgi:hypothetical protein
MGGAMKFLQFLKNLFWQWQWIPFLVIAIAAWALSQPVEAQEDFSISAPCETCFQYFEDTERVWSGQVEVVFNPDNRPWWADTRDIKNMIEGALRYIDRYIDSPLVYGGMTSAELIGRYEGSRVNTVMIQFVPLESLGYGHIWWNWEGNQHINYGEIKINDQITEAQMPGVLLHELLHIHNLAHSDSRHSIMSGPPYGKYKSAEYQATLRRDDILALQNLYEAKPNLGPSLMPNGCVYLPEIEYEKELIQATLCDPESVEVISNERDTGDY